MLVRLQINQGAFLRVHLGPFRHQRRLCDEDLREAGGLRFFQWLLFFLEIKSF
jgi:hypothetical protein